MHILAIFVIVASFVTVPAFAQDNECDFFCWLANLFNFNSSLVGFDCADKFEKYMKTVELTFRGNQGYEPGFAGLVFGGIFTNSDLGFELLDNRCFTTIKSWAYKTDYEYLIWNEMDWEFMSYIEQMYNHEVECPQNYDALCTAKELRKLQK